MLKKPQLLIQLDNTVVGKPSKQLRVRVNTALDGSERRYPSESAEPQSFGLMQHHKL